MKSILITALFLAEASNAATTIQRRAYANTLFEKMHKTVRNATISCGDDGYCRLQWDEIKGKPFTFEDKKAREDADRAQMAGLAAKWQTGTITDAEKDQLLKMLVLDYLGR